MKTNLFCASGISYDNFDENLVNYIIGHGGWDDKYHQLGMHHDDNKTLKFANNTYNGGWWTVLINKNEYLKIKRKLECRYFHNSRIPEVPFGAEVQRVSPFKFIYKGKTYCASIISEDEINDKIKEAKKQLDFWENFRGKCNF